MAGRYTPKASHAGSGCWCGEAHEVGICQSCGGKVQQWSDMGMVGPVGAAPMDCDVFHRECLGRYATTLEDIGPNVVSRGMVTVVVAGVGPKVVELLEVD